MNSFFTQKYDKIISIGSNCYPKLFIKLILKPSYGETELFDYIGTSMWAINALLRNNFQDMLIDEEYTLLPILKDWGPIVTNKRYHLRFAHDLLTVNAAKSPVFKSKILRRIDRFKTILQTSKNLLFIRYQENLDRMIHYHTTNTTEYEELTIFLSLLKSIYNCENVTILYINAEKDGWNDSHDILSIKIDTLYHKSQTVHNTLQKLFEKKNIIDLLK